MGMRIGQNTESFASLASARVDRSAQPQPRESSQAALSESAGTARDSQYSRPGFVNDTLSPNSAALQTLDVNLENAREVVPSVQELRESFQESRAEAQAVQAERAQQSQEAALQTQAVRPEAAPEVRAFEQVQRETQAVQAPAVSEVGVETSAPAPDMTSAGAPPVAPASATDRPQGSRLDVVV